MHIIQKPSPNYRAGRLGYHPEAVVIHIMDGTLGGTDAWFQNPASRVSAHYGIGKHGAVHQYVQEQDTAWHAGRVKAPTWVLLKAQVNPNLYTLAVEHEGHPDDVWPLAQQQASAALLAALCQRHHIPLDRAHVIGHYQIYAKKPHCPARNKSILDTLIQLAIGVTALQAPGGLV
jgi:N-acetylmuramoyl-L-alanine amidase